MFWSNVCLKTFGKIIDILLPTGQYINEANFLLQPGGILVYICYYTSIIIHVTVEQGYLHPS